MNRLKKLKEEIEKVKIGYDYEKNYSELYNKVVDYENETQNFFGLTDLFNDIVDYELVEQIAKNELEASGLIRLYYFLGNANLNNDIFKIDSYGNLEDIHKDDFDLLKQEIIDLIEQQF